MTSARPADPTGPSALDLVARRALERLSAQRDVVRAGFAVGEGGGRQLLFTSITNRDYPVVQAIVVVSAVLVILVNLMVDLSYSFLDPRVTYE